MDGETEKSQKILENGVNRNELYCLLKSIEKKIQTYQNEDDLNYVNHIKISGNANLVW